MVMVLFAVIGPFFAPHHPGQLVGAPHQGLGHGGVLGTDQLGRDVWSRVLWGGHNLAWMCLSAAAAGVAIGTAIGLTAGYYGGIVDTILMRCMDGLLAFPAIVFTLLFVSMLGPSRWRRVVLGATGHVPGVARVMRGAARPVLNQEYVQWARAVGLPTRHILGRQVLPNVTSPLMVELGLRVMWSIGILASLSYLGFGIQPPAADWGLMVSENKYALSVQPLAVLAPLVCIAIFATGANLFAEGMSRVIARTEGSRSS
jgi:peptide/nickel transport system permease protein